MATTLVTPIKCWYKGLRKYDVECELYSPSSWLGTVVGCCEHGSETLGSITGD